MMADMVKSLAALLAERYSRNDNGRGTCHGIQFDTYRKVMDEQTHFYHQSPRYVFRFSEEELAKGKFE